MSTASGTTPARSRHRGANLFHPLPIDAQLLGSEVMDLRQYRQTWVKKMIGLGSVSETKVAQIARTSGGRRFTGCSEFLKGIALCRISLACFSRTSIYKVYSEHSRFPFDFCQRSYFSGQCGNQNAGHRRYHRPYSRIFRGKFLVQRVDELFQREFKSDIGHHRGWGEPCKLGCAWPPSWPRRVIF